MKNIDVLGQPPLRVEFERGHWRGQGETWTATLYRNGNAAALENVEFAAAIPSMRKIFEAAGIPTSIRENGGVEKPRHLCKRSET